MSIVKRVGVYLRPWNVDFYVKLAHLSFEDYDVVTISEFKGVGDYWLGDNTFSSGMCSPLSFDIKNDIYLRCRFLRGLSIDKAFRLIDRQYLQIKDIFVSNNFSFFIGSLIDNYTLDIIEKVCVEIGIPYISIVSHFIDGYSRFSSRGELVKINRDITEEEVDTVLSMLNQMSYKPSYEINKRKSILECHKYFYREKVKRYIFSAIKYLKRDIDNYHYNSIQFKGLKKSEVIDTKKSYFSKIDDISVSHNSVYLPLHFTPEATVDYWCDNPQDALYERSIIDLIEKSDKNINFIIKEHPAMFMKRHLEFYNNILKFNNATLLDPYESSNELIHKVKNVYVYTGSVGVEALIRGKNVISRTNNYYSGLTESVKIVNSLSLTDLQMSLSSFESRIFIKDLLRELIPTSFVNNKKMLENDIKMLSVFIKKTYIM